MSAVLDAPETPEVVLYHAPVAGRSPVRRSRSERTEALVVFALAMLVYAVVGWRVVSASHVVSFEAMDRLARAYMVWWDDPTKLAAIGFSYPPLGALAYLPMALLKPLATSLLALPLLTALFGAATVTMVGRLMARCGLAPRVRWTMLALFALNPLWLFYASNGAPDMIALFLLAWGLLALVSWHQTGQVVYLAGTGVAFGLGIMTRYGLSGLAAVVAVLVVLGALRQRPARGRVEGTAIGYLAPVLYAVALWTLFNWMILGSPLQWLTTPPSSSAVNSAVVSAPDASVVGTIARALEVTGGVAPLAVLALGLGLAAWMTVRDELALGVVAILVAVVALIGADALLAGDQARVTLADGLPVALVAIVGVAVVCRDGGALRRWGVTGALAVLAVALPLTVAMMDHYPYQDQEQAFVRALRTGDDLTGQTSLGGYRVGIANERAMAGYIKRVVGERRHAVLTDNARTYGVILLSGRPAVFRDRVQDGDGPWHRALEAPWGRVPYLLIDTESSDDLVHRRWPGAAQGRDGFVPVFRTPRYTLVRVPKARAATP